MVGDVAQARGKVRVRSELILGRWMSIESFGKCVDVSASAEMRDKLGTFALEGVKDNLIARLFMHLPSFPTRSPTVLPVVVLVSLQQVCIQSLFLMSASAPWGDSTLWSLMADNALEISNLLTLEMIPT